MGKPGHDPLTTSRAAGIAVLLVTIVALFALLAPIGIPAADAAAAPAAAAAHSAAARAIVAHAAVAHAQASRTASSTLSVALFPWVPRPGQVERAVAAAWRERHPDVPLEFVFWDCYATEPPAGVDVFVFDAIFLDRYAGRGLAQPLAEDEVDDPADILPYALRAARGADGDLYGVPMYGCANLLFYRRGDTALERADDLGDVVRALGPARYTTARPPAGTGLLVDLSDPSTSACLYVEALQDTYGTYTPDPPLAPSARKLDLWALDNVRDLRVMAGTRQAGLVTSEPFDRSKWFSSGRGRALVTFSEGLSDMSAATRDRVEFTVLPLGNDGRGDVRLFYTDIVSLDPDLRDGAKRDLALELANLIASRDVMVAAVGPSVDDPTPQYLFPVRRSVYEALTPRYPLYGRMYELIGAPQGSSAEPRPFRLGAGGWDWLRRLGPVIKRQVFAGS